MRRNCPGEGVWGFEHTMDCAGVWFGKNSLVLDWMDCEG